MTCRVKTVLTGQDGPTILDFSFMQQTTIDEE